MDLQERWELLTDWYHQKRILTVTRQRADGKEITRTGMIFTKPEINSGVWGYQGDAIAVYIKTINNQRSMVLPFPSEEVINQNL